jgi:hypothetical protein
LNGVKGFEREVFIRSFTAKDGREVRLRFPRWSGLDDMLELISSLVEEGAEILTLNIFATSKRLGTSTRNLDTGW